MSSAWVDIGGADAVSETMPLSALVEGLAVGTVAPAPSRTSTWSRGIDALATAVAPNNDAILPAPADAPAP